MQKAPYEHTPQDDRPATEEEFFRAFAANPRDDEMRRIFAQDWLEDLSADPVCAFKRDFILATLASKQLPFGSPERIAPQVDRLIAYQRLRAACTNAPGYKEGDPNPADQWIRRVFPPAESTLPNGPDQPSIDTLQDSLMHPDLHYLSREPVEVRGSDYLFNEVLWLEEYLSNGYGSLRCRAQPGVLHFHTPTDGVPDGIYQQSSVGKLQLLTPADAENVEVMSASFRPPILPRTWGDLFRVGMVASTFHGLRPFFANLEYNNLSAQNVYEVLSRSFAGRMCALNLRGNPIGEGQQSQDCFDLPNTHNLHALNIENCGLADAQLNRFASHFPNLRMLALGNQTHQESSQPMGRRTTLMNRYSSDAIQTLARNAQMPELKLLTLPGRLLKKERDAFVEAEGNLPHLQMIVCGDALHRSIIDVAAARAERRRQASPQVTEVHEVRPEAERGQGREKR